MLFYYISVSACISDWFAEIRDNILEKDNAELKKYRSYVFCILDSINTKNIKEVITDSNVNDNTHMILEVLDAFINIIYDDTFMYIIGNEIPKVDLFNISRSDKIFILTLELYKHIFFLDSFYKKFNFSCSAETLNQPSFLERQTPQEDSLILNYIYATVRKIYKDIILYNESFFNKKSPSEQKEVHNTYVSVLNQHVVLRNKKKIGVNIEIDQYSYLYTSWSPEIPSLYLNTFKKYLEFETYVEYLKLRSTKICPYVKTNLFSTDRFSYNFERISSEKKIRRFTLPNDKNSTSYLLLIHDYKHIHIQKKDDNDSIGKGFIGNMKFYVNENNMRFLFRLIYFYCITSHTNVLVQYKKFQSNKYAPYQIKVIYDNSEVYFTNFRIENSDNDRKELHNRNIQEGFNKYMKRKARKSHSFHGFVHSSQNKLNKLLGRADEKQITQTNNYVSHNELDFEICRIKKRIEFLDRIKGFKDLCEDHIEFIALENEMLHLKKQSKSFRSKLKDIFSTKNEPDNFDKFIKCVFEHKFYISELEKHIKLLNHTSSVIENPKVKLKKSGSAYFKKLQKLGSKSTLTAEKNWFSTNYMFFSKPELDSISEMEDLGLCFYSHLDPLNLNDSSMVETHKVYQTFHFVNLIVLTDSLKNLISHYKESIKVIRRYNDQISLEKYSSTHNKLKNNKIDSYINDYIGNQLKILCLNYNELNLESMMFTMRLHIIILTMNGIIKSSADIKEFYPIISKYYSLASEYLKNIIVSTYYKIAFQQSSIELGFTNKKYLSIEIFRENLVGSETSESIHPEHVSNGKIPFSRIVLRHSISENEEAINDCSKITKEDIVYVDNGENFHVKRYTYEHLLNLYFKKYETLFKRI